MRLRDGVELVELVLEPLEAELVELEEKTGEPFELPAELAAAALALELR